MLDACARSLAEEHLPLVRTVLAGVAAHYPRHADREELAQAAALGLVEAAHRYDPTRGVPFERWAALRIRGAIVDASRASDFAPRALRSAAREVEAARAELEGELRRAPTAAETARRAGITVDALARVRGRVHQSLVLSLDASCGEDAGDPQTLGSTLVDGDAADPLTLLEERERATYVRDALACLPDRLRAVVVGYFLEGETSAALSARFGVTESRVSQMRTEALALMRTAIEGQYAESVTAVPAPEPGQQGVARRTADYTASVGSRSTFSSRLARVPAPVPAPRVAAEDLQRAG